MRAIYAVRTSGDAYRFSADLEQANAPLCYIVNDSHGEGCDEASEDIDRECSTPYQTADAKHDMRRAACLILAYLGSDFWLSPDVVVGEDKDGNTTYNGRQEVSLTA